MSEALLRRAAYRLFQLAGPFLDLLVVDDVTANLVVTYRDDFDAAISATTAAATWSACVDASPQLRHKFALALEQAIDPLAAYCLAFESLVAADVHEDADKKGLEAVTAQQWAVLTLLPESHRALLRDALCDKAADAADAPPQSWIDHEFARHIRRP